MAGLLTFIVLFKLKEIAMSHDCVTGESPVYYKYFIYFLDIVQYSIELIRVTKANVFTTS